jgi:hypothetical protein
MRGEEFGATKINRLPSKNGLNATANSQDYCERRNHDRGESCPSFWRPFRHIQIPQFLIGLVGFLAFTAAYAGLLLFLTTERR